MFLGDTWNHVVAGVLCAADQNLHVLEGIIESKMVEAFLRMRTGYKAGNEEHGSMAPRLGDVAHIEKKEKGETRAKPTEIYIQ